MFLPSNVSLNFLLLHQSGLFLHPKFLLNWNIPHPLLQLSNAFVNQVNVGVVEISGSMAINVQRFQPYIFSRAVHRNQSMKRK
jgi:hypothetical protein